MSEERSLLIDSLWRDARREGEEILRAAREQAGRALAATQAKAEATFREARERAAAETAPEAARARNRARQAAGGRLLVRQKELLDSLFADLEAELAGGGITRGEAAKALDPLLAEVLEGLPHGATGVVRVNPGDAGRCGALVAAGGWELTVVPDPTIAGGALLELSGGCETRDNTLAGRLRTLRDSPPLGLFAALFPPSPESVKAAAEG